MNKLKTFEDYVSELLAESMNESVLPGEFEGMYYLLGKKINQVKKVGNRFFYYDRIQARWMPIKKDKVEFTDLTWEQLADKIAKQ